MKKKIVLSLTTGDVNGIGFEVAAKALLKIKIPKNLKILLWRSSDGLKKYQNLLDRKYKNPRFQDPFSALAFLQNENNLGLAEVIRTDSPALWVEQSARLCMQQEMNGMVTGPLSKTSIIEAGLNDMGHTGILSRISNCPDIFMTFLGKHFNVLTLTGHVPLSAVENEINLMKLHTALQMSLVFRRKLPLAQSKLPIAVLGLNPHASENGLIGKFDIRLAAHVPMPHFVGPLVPDVAFLKDNWKKYCMFVCMYHDQALIPFKMVHGQDSGAHLSLGLPFVRTSVDHGTAKDIFKRDIANCNSMIDAIKWANNLILQGE